MDFRFISTAKGTIMQDANGNDIILSSDDYVLRTSFNLEVAVSEISFLKDDLESKIALDPTLTSSFGLSLIWKIGNSYFGGIVTCYTINRTHVKLSVSSPQFLFDKEILSSVDFDSVNPRRVTIDKNFNSTWTYYRSGKPARLLAALAAVKSPIPATSDTFSERWGGVSSEVTLDPVNLLTVKEVMSRVFDMEYCPMVNWGYMLRDGVYTLMLMHSIDSEYSTAAKYEVLSSWLPDDFNVEIDNSCAVTTGWCVSQVGNVTDTQVLYASYSHQMNNDEPLGICEKIQINGLSNGGQLEPYARALEERVPQFEFTFKVPCDESFKKEDSAATTKVKDVASLNFVLFKNVFIQGDTLRGIITRSELTPDAATFTVSKALYREFNNTYQAYLNLIQESLSISNKKDIFGALYSNGRKINSVRQLTP